MHRHAADDVGSLTQTDTRQTDEVSVSQRSYREQLNGFRRENLPHLAGWNFLSSSVSVSL